MKITSEITSRGIPLAHPDKFFIAGKWVDASSKDIFEVRDCTTEEVVASIAKAHSQDASNAIAAAREAFDHGPWPRMSHQARGDFLEKIAVKFEALNDEFAKIWSKESGIVYSVAKPRIGQFLSGAFRQYSVMASSFPFIEELASVTGHQAYSVHEPVGVVLAIVPWNGPAGLMAYKVAPALLAGCSIVIKSSPEAPCSAYLFAQMLDELGLPPGVVNVITADRDVSEEMVRDQRVDKITFTGSTVAGRKIAASAADRMARVTLELGGKSPALVLDDFDVETAAVNIGKSFFGYLSGQVCHSLTRILVPRAKHDLMAEALREVAHSMVLGDPFDDSTTAGPLATERQRELVEHYVALGISQGARLAYGGRRPAHLNRGYFFEPTVFAHVDNRSSIAQDEIFGPVLSIISYESESEAIAIANDTIYGLNAVVFTHEHERAFSIARQLRSGSVGHNASRTDFSIGFGGFKQSGLGREGGVEGLMAFMETKTIVMDALVEQ